MDNRPMAPITELELRSQLKDWLSPRMRGGSARMFEEFGVERGAARIDLAVVARHLEAYELKSDLDTFSRMHNQIHAYNRVFDRLWLVAGSTHAGAAVSVVPRWWGILVAERNAAHEVEMRQLRPARVNPVQQGISLALLLWREEAIELIQTYGVRATRRATRAELSERLAEALDLETLRDCVAKMLSKRTMVRAATL